MITGRRRWWTLFVLVLVGAMNIFDRQLINILAQDIKVELVISDTQLGLLTGTAFGIFYSVLGIPLGRLADRLDRIRLIATTLVMWCGLTSACGLAQNFMQLFVLRSGVGVGEAGSQPASTALVSELFPGEGRVSAMSILLLGAPIGSFFGLAIGGYIASHWGWRNAFIFAGLPGLILALILLLTTKDPRTSAGASPAQDSFFGALIELARNPILRWEAIGLVACSFFIYAPGAWLPAMFARIHGMTTGQIGASFAIAVGLGGGVGTLGGGYICEYLRPRVLQPQLSFLLGSLAIMVPLLLCVVVLQFKAQALVALFLFNVFAFSFLGPVVTLIQESVPLSRRGLAVAVCISLSNILNLCVGIPLVGAISDALKPAHGPSSIQYALAITALAAGGLALLAHMRTKALFSASMSGPVLGHGS